MKISAKKRSTLYREAARRMERGQGAHLCCIALEELDPTGELTTEFSRLFRDDAIAYGYDHSYYGQAYVGAWMANATHKPEADREYDGDHREGMDLRHFRIVALCLIAAIVEAGGL